MGKIKATASQEEKLREKLAELKEQLRTTRVPEEMAKLYRAMTKVRGALGAVVKSRKYGTLVEESVISEALKDP